MLTSLAEELDVLFAHAHITQRRPTIVAAELPKLTDHQISELTERYEIHSAEVDKNNIEAYGAAPNSGTPDTTLPPQHPEALSGAKGPRRSGEGSGNNTRVGTPDVDTAVAKAN